MALRNNDLFVVQSQTDNKLYKLKLEDLVTEIEGGAPVNFRGAVDLNNPPISSGVNLPAANGDLYVVESDANTIDAGWVMQGSVTSASQGDRIIYDGDDTNWILITSGTNNTGTVTNVTASLPLESDGDSVDPVISILEARTTAAATGAADGKGTAGAVARLADADDVVHTSGTGAADAVVTADLLKATNDAVESLATAAGISSISEGGTDIVSGALDIQTDAGNNATIGVKEDVFCPADFSALTDITL